MENLLIIDGSYLLFQSYYGMPNKIVNSNGQNIEAVICFIGMLLKTIIYTSASKLLIVFDGENKLARQDIDISYKANRTIDAKDNPFAQLEMIKTMLDRLKFDYIETTDCEADDYIASVSNVYKNKYNIIISSNDKDFFQLIDKNVSVFSYRGKHSTLWTENLVLEKYGFNPIFFTTLKALIGDPSDNIKGIKGIGIKTATMLIKKYGDLSNIIEKSENIEDRIFKMIYENKTKLIQNYEIIDLKDAHVKIHNFEYRFVFPNKKTNVILKELNLL